MFGSALLNSRLDRYLAVAGRAGVATDQGVEDRLLTWAELLARVPQLAIHLDPGANETVLALDRQTKLAPVGGAEAVGGSDAAVRLGP